MGKPQKRSPELIALAVELYNRLKSGNAVARRLDLSPPTVYRMLRDAGVDVPDWTDPKPDRIKLKGDAEKAAVHDYAVTGLSLEELEAKYGVGMFAIRSAVKRAGLPLRSVGGAKRRVLPSEEPEIIRLRGEGLTQAQIAARIGCQQGVISRVLISAGLRVRPGDNHGSWKGGLSKNGEGYVMERIEPDDPFAVMRGRNGYVPQHRLVMARCLGRPLTDSETVHHIDGDKKHNRIENLQLRQGRHGRGVIMKCNHCGSHDVFAVELPL